MPTTTNLNIFYWNNLDPASADLWGDDWNDALITLDSEHATKTIAQDFADFALKRPKLQDYSEALYAHGSVSSTVTVNLTNGNNQSMTLTADTTMSISNAPPSGNMGMLFIRVSQDATGGWTLTFPSAFKDASGATFAITDETASTMTEVFAYTDDGGTTWRTKQGTTWS